MSPGPDTPSSPDGGGLTRWRIDLAWDGRAYLGWQRQPQGPTIQQAVEDALAIVLGGERVSVRASGRTDAGVHARQQVAGFQTSARRSPDAVIGGLNRYLPSDIACLGARPVVPEFDPRRWTRSKLYRYRILVRRARCPFRHGQVWHLARALDVEAMERAAGCLVGRHDFSSFRARGCTAEHAVRNLVAARVYAQGDEVRLEFEGHGFLRHQVRIMTGTLVAVGLGRCPAEWVAEVLLRQDRNQAGETAPADGLWLMRVDCGDEPRRP